MKTSESFQRSFKFAVLIGLCSFVLGAGVVLVAQKLAHKVTDARLQQSSAQSVAAATDPNAGLGVDPYAQPNSANSNNSGNSGTVAANNSAPTAVPGFANAFQQMQQMRKIMAQQIQQAEQGEQAMNSWFNQQMGGMGQVNGDGSSTIKRREDKNYVYYDIAAKGLGSEKLNVSVADGQINVSSQVDKKSQSNGSGSYFSSSFNQSFPIPPNVDANKVQMQRSKDLVTLKFPKIDNNG